MDIIFANDKLAKVFNNHRLLVREYGDLQAQRIRRRLDELRAADTLEDVRHLPQARCHELKGDLAGLLSVDLVHPYRLLFAPAEDPLPTKPDGGLDWTRVAAVIIVEVKDTHAR